VTGLLRRSSNRIQIEVANLAVNSMAARPVPDRSQIDAIFGERVRNKERRQEPVTAGLLGPIQLIATEQ